MQNIRVNAPRMVHETVDGEVIIIDLATGTYYSLPGASAEIWNSITLGGGRGDMVARVADRYGEDETEIRPTLDRFFDQLLTEELVVVETTEPAESPSGEKLNEPPSAPFTQPVIEKFTDMAELILLDPVHDVSSVGWPEQTDG